MDKWKRCFALVACCVIFLNFAQAVCLNEVNAKKNNPYKIVRVGWYQSAMFQDGIGDDKTKSGYCYDYLQKVADYTYWKYEYVYGNWEDLFLKLQSGEIDFLAGVSETSERRKTMLFPESPMGTDQYFLFKKSGNTEILSENISSLNGKTLGAIGNTRMTDLAQAWIEENRMDVKLVFFKDFISLENALKDDSVDLIVQTINNVLNMNNIDIVIKVGEEPFYLAVSKQKEELLRDLNYSLGKIISIDPFILQDLQYKNYGANLINKTLSENEKNWLKRHKKLIVGYLDNYLPFSSTDKDSSATGLMTDVLSAIINSLELNDSLNLEFHAYKDYGDMMEALKSGQICTAFPVYGSLWNLETDGINASSVVVNSSEAFFYKGTYRRENVKKIAVNENNRLQQVYCKRMFPEAQLIFCSSIEESLDMVVSGKADGTLINMLRTELVTRNSKYNSLSFIQLESYDSRCFGVNEGNAELLTILNRGLKVIGSTYGIDSAYKYMKSFYKYGLVDFLRDNIGWIVLIAGSVVVAVILLLIMSLRRKAGEVQKKEESIRQVTAFNQKIEMLKDKADKANAAKTLFLNNMSHDIRTPMNAIIGYTDIAQKQTENPEVKEYLGKIRDSSEHLLSLINDVLDISRIESGTVKINSDATDICRLTDEVLNIVNGYLSDRKLNFEFEKSKNASPFVVTDAVKIREILVNILGNAVKFTDDGGTIKFIFELNPDENGKVNVRYTISDTGRGMSEEFQNHIFEEFSQENNGARTQYKGTGLGLTITKKYVEMMGGTISFKSKMNEGTTFVVEFPMEASSKELLKPKETASDLHDVNGIKILLAEDNNLNAEIAQIQLEEVGAIVTRASDGKETFEMFKNNPAGTFDLILMDVMMPNMNGYEATKAIRSLQERPDGKTIPIIAMTANAFVEDVQMSLNSGMTAHITKPIKSEELKKIVAQTTNEHQKIKNQYRNS